MTQTTISCPHCAAPNEPGDAFCGSCGKALPLAKSSPRLVDTNQIPTSGATSKLVSDDLKKQTKKAANALLAVGILRLVLVGLLTFGSIQSQVPGGIKAVPGGQLFIIFGVEIGMVSCLFFALYFWARVSPLPACIVGLITYATLIGINVVTFISLAKANNAIGSPVGILDIVIVVVLVNGIAAAIKQRRLLTAQAGVAA